MNISELFAALGNWHNDQTPLLGVPESQEIEFKTAPYQLSDDRQKLEFAKDVAGMANGGGGVIVIGIETARNATIGQDVSIRLHPLAPGSVNVDSMNDVARAWIHPPLRDLEISDWPDSSRNNLLISIRVPPFHEAPGLRLVRGAEVGTRVDNRMFSVPSRSGGRVDSFTPAEVYEWIRRGRTALQVGPDEGGEQLPLDSDQTEIDAQFERTRTILGNDDWPVFVLQGWPLGPRRVERMHDAEGVRGLFTNPPSLRPTGFNFRWWSGVEPEVEPGGGIRMPGRNRGVYWLTQSGIFTLVVTGGPDLLCWGIPTPPLIINPLVLVELTYEFSSMYLDGLSPFLSLTEWGDILAQFRIALLDAHRPEPIHLPKGPLRRFRLQEFSKPSPDNDIIETVGDPFRYRNVVPQDVPAAVAADMLQPFYARFGIGTEDIPYLREDRGAVSTEALLEAGLAANL